MGSLVVIAVLAGLAYFFYGRFQRAKRSAGGNRAAGRPFELLPANAASIFGVLAIIPGLWILKVEGWTETTSFNLRTGQSTTTSSTFGAQFAKAAVWFAIGAALLYASRVLSERQVNWPPGVHDFLAELGLVQRVATPLPPAPKLSGRAGTPGMTRFNAPPTWPPMPPGWIPGPDWKPDPSWPPAPAGWQFWTEAPTRTDADG